MARETGQYRKMLLEQQAQNERSFWGADGMESEGISGFHVQFYVSLALFLCFVLLDYTGKSVYNLNSHRILAEIQKDMTQELHIDELLAGIMEQIEITEEDFLPADAEVQAPAEEEPSTKEEASAEDGAPLEDETPVENGAPVEEETPAEDGAPLKDETPGTDE